MNIRVIITLDWFGLQGLQPMWTLLVARMPLQKYLSDEQTALETPSPQSCHSNTHFTQRLASRVKVKKERACIFPGLYSFLSQLFHFS